MWQSAQPLAQQPLDLLRREPIGQPLKQSGVCTRFDAVVEGLERNPPLGKLAFQVLMAVDAQLGVVGKVRAELQKERPEVFVDAIEIVVVDHPSRLHNPGIGRTRALTAATFGPHDAGLFLRLADIQHALALLELPQVLLGDIVLAPALLEGNEINTFASDELLNVANERLSHRRDGRRGGKPLAPVNPKVSHHAAYRLQGRHVDVEIHPVNRLVLKHHMITYYVRNATCYRHRGLRSSTGPRTHRASSSYIQGMSLEARPESTGDDRKSPISSAHVVLIYLVGLRRSLARYVYLIFQRLCSRYVFPWVPALQIHWKQIIQHCFPAPVIHQIK